MRSRRLAGALIAVMVVSGCNTILGVPDDLTRSPDVSDAADASSMVTTADADVDVTMAVCPKSTEVDECFRCTDEACCNDYSPCHADPRCAQYFQTCIPECEQSGKPYHECVVACDATNHGGHVRFAPYNACAEVHCLGPCAKTKAADPCTQCAVAACVDAYSTCFGDADCDTLVACVNGCNGSDSCSTACRSGKSQSALTKGDALFACWATYCRSTCVAP